MTAHAELKAKYTKYLEVGFLLAVVFHAVAFAFWPEYVPSVYKLREKKLEVVEVPPQIEIPPPPQEIERPEVAVEVEASEEASEEETIAPTLFDAQNLPPAPPPPPPEPEMFLAFDTYPQVVQSAKPKYPELARKAEVEGIVVVMVTIDETGKVIRAWIGESSAEILNEAALEAAYKFKFTPAMQRDVPVKATISIPFRFSLSD
ncbi:MAG: energy transducer TonB [bacterium]